MARLNGSSKWVFGIVAAVVTTASLTYAVATDSVGSTTDSVEAVVSNLDKTNVRVNQLERDSTRVTTAIEFILAELTAINKKLDRALED